MEQLAPIETLVQNTAIIIGQQLTLRDLAACCAASPRMRELFGLDFLWRPYCDQSLAEHLSTTPCEVHPVFDNPDNNPTNDPTRRLSLIGYWRLAYMRQCHLRRNWRLGHVSKVHLVLEEDDEETEFVHAAFKFLTNDCIIGVYDGTVFFYDVRQIPVTHMIPPLVLPFEFGPYVDIPITVSEDQLVLIFRDAILIYQLDFINNTLSRQYTLTLEYDGKTRESFSQIHAVIRPYFIGTSLNRGTMHIWDLTTGIKVKAEECPVDSVFVGEIKTSGKMNLVTAFRIDEPPTFILKSYSLETFTYFDFQILLPSCYDYEVCYDFVSIYDVTQLCVFNYVTCEQIYLSHPHDYFSRILDKFFLFAEDRNLILFDPDTLETRILFNNIVSRYFEVLKNKFIQFNVFYFDRSVEMLEIDCKSLTTRPLGMNMDFYLTDQCLNKATTRYIDEGIIYCYW